MHSSHNLTMIVKSIKTRKITQQDNDIFPILDRFLPRLKERSILAVTSKIVAICEGRTLAMKNVDKDKLIKQEADYYIPRQKSKHSIVLTITHNTLIASAGIDESNGNGSYVLWPVNPQKTANQIRQYLVKRFSVKEVGVIITDSKTTPLRRGTTGFTLAHSGFSALTNYIDQPDIFGRALKMTQANIADGLGAAAVLMMGEGSEQTPLAVIEDIPFVKFQQRNPTKKELNELRIPLQEDLYALLLTSAQWYPRNT